MKNLLQTHSVSWAQSVRLTLESEGVPRGLMLLAVGFVLFVSSLVVFNQDGPRLLGYAIMATSVAAFVGGFVLIAIGPRADRPDQQGP